MSRRRPMTMRKILDMQFRTFERGLDAMLRSEPQGDHRNRLEIIRDKVGELHELAVTSVDGAPPLESDTVSRVLEGRDQDRVEAFLRRHLSGEIEALGIVEASTERLVDDLVEGLRWPGTLSEIARSTVEKHGIRAAEFTSELLETVLREAVGLDGRVPQPGYSEDVAAANLYSMRMTLGCVSHDIRDTYRGEAPLPEDANREGSAPEPGVLSETYHLALAHLTGDVFDRLKMMMGSEVPEAEREAVHRALERAAMAAAPRIVMDDGPEPG